MIKWNKMKLIKLIFLSASIKILSPPKNAQEDKEMLEYESQYTVGFISTIKVSN